jgi:uncharacterized ubiquitin-like protein YukD
MTRNKTVRVSDEELKLLKEYRAEQYDMGIPLGYVIKQLLNQKMETIE